MANTVFIVLNIGTPKVINILVPDFDQFTLLLADMSKNCWMSGKQCRPWLNATECGI